MIASLARVIHKRHAGLAHEYRIAVTSAHPDECADRRKDATKQVRPLPRECESRDDAGACAAGASIVRVARKPDRPPVRCLMLFDLGENFFGNAARERSR